jgi:hypothetical protein
MGIQQPNGAGALPRTVQYSAAGYVEYVDTDSDLSPGSERRRKDDASDGSISDEVESADEVLSCTTDAPSEEDGAAAPLDAVAIETFLAGAQVNPHMIP